VEVSNSVNSASLEDREASTIYDTTGLLLMLGKPGSGKTTTLLDLAQILLERARNEQRERVPVIVNLSSWKKKQSLAE
jgi:predicted NACHT family NTPase